MDNLEWRPLRGVDPDRLSEARLQAHHAVQWLARAARAFVPPQPDDAHTSLGWDAGVDGFMTHRLQDGTTRLSLQIPALTLALHSGAGPLRIQSFPLTGRSETQTRQWLGEQLGALGYDPQALDAPPPYEIPAHPISAGARYDTAGSADALTEIAAWYANAQIALDRVHRQIIGRKLEASAVRCWPHHFDLATQIVFSMNADMPGNIGAGFSPGDEYYAEPYFYVSVYPEPDPAMLPMLPAMGHWHTHEFTAGVKPAHKILAAKDRATETDDFLQGSVAIAFQILGQVAK